MKTIAEAWASYRTNVVPKDAPTVQLVETRNAFYAGALSMFNVQMQIGEASVSEGDAMKILHSLEMEMQAFALECAHPITGAVPC